MNNLSDILRQEATRLSACHKAIRRWPENGDPQKLIDLWKENLDFAVEKDFPKADFIKANFDADLLHRNLIFVDEHLDLEDAPSGIYILNGECDGIIRFKGWAAATLYIRHASNVTIMADDFAKVFVRLYDDARADVVDFDDAVSKVYDRRR